MSEGIAGKAQLPPLRSSSQQLTNKDPVTLQLVQANGITSFSDAVIQHYLHHQVQSWQSPSGSSSASHSPSFQPHDRSHASTFARRREKKATGEEFYEIQDCNYKYRESRHNDARCWTEISMFQYWKFQTEAVCACQEYFLNVVRKAAYLSVMNVVKWLICL